MAPLRMLYIMTLIYICHRIAPLRMLYIMTLIYICHRIAPLRMLYIMTLIYISRSRILKWEYLENGGSKRKCSSLIFIEVDICHRMGPWQMWHLPSFSRSNIFLLCICYKTMHRQRMSPADLPRLTRPRREFVFFSCRYVPPPPPSSVRHQLEAYFLVQESTKHPLTLY